MRSRPARAVLAVALSLAATLVLAASQGPSQPQATFRAGVDLVDVEVSVLDRYRLPVRGLTAEDFTVLEEGKARPVAAFTPVDLPMREHRSAAWMDDIPGDVQANDFAREGRLIVLLMDQSVDPADAPEARRIAEAAVDQMRPGDLAAVAWTVYGVPQNFTSDRRRLIDAIRQPSLNLPAGDTAATASCYCGACGLQLMADVAESVQDVRQRRKLLIFIGHRLPQGMGGCGSVVEDAQRRILRAADVGNLTIHVVDPKGVVTLAPTASMSAAPQETPSSNIRRIANLTTYTAHTGGRFVTRNMAADAVPEVFRESGSYYVLGFQPAYTGTDGRFRRITVKVNRPDVTVQARGGYYAQGRSAAKAPKVPTGLPPALVQAIAGFWPRPDVRVSVGATPVAVPGVRGGAVAVLMNVEQDLSPSGPRASTLAAAFFARPHTTTVTVLTGAFDANGREYGYDRRTATVTPRAIGDRRFAYDVASRLELRPGHYEIRSAVEDSTLGQVGSAYTYVTVPDFAKETVSLSGVFLESTGSGRTLAGAGIADLTTVLPSTRRRFARDEQVTAFVASYQGQTHDARPGYVITEIYNDTDQRVYQQELRIVPASPDQRTAMFSVDLPISRLSPGEYLLTMQVRQGNANARRDVKFEVQ